MRLYSSTEMKALSDIIHVINAANTADDLSDAIARIGVAVQAQSGSIVLVRADGRGAGKAVLYNMEESFYDKYRREYFSLDDIFPKAMARGFRIWRPTDIVTQKEWETSEVYTDLLRPRGIFHTMVSAFGTALVPRGLMFLTRDRLDEPFSDEDLEFIEIIHPHLDAALREITLAQMTDKTGASLIYGVDTMSRPVYILNEDNTPIYINAAARRQCATAGITEKVMLSELCDSLESWNAFSEPGSVQCSDAYISMAGHTYALYSIVVEGSEARYRVVMLVSGKAFRRLSLIVLATRYGLTERESEVCEMLTRGLTNKEIAASLFISDQTVKDHVKAVLGKLKLSSRTEVPPLILGLL